MATNDFAPAGQLSQTGEPELPAAQTCGEQPEVEDAAADEALVACERANPKMAGNASAFQRA